LLRLPAWRHPGQLPQDGNVARVTGLWRVRGESFTFTVCAKTKDFLGKSRVFAQSGEHPARISLVFDGRGVGPGEFPAHKG
jgi:hypothetical protein